MFFEDDHKKAVTTILGKRNGKGQRVMEPAPVKPEKMMSEGGEIDERHVAAEDILGALHEKSPERLMHALSNFVDLHMNAKEVPVDTPDEMEEK